MIYLRTVNPGYGSIELHAEEDAYLAVNDYAYGCCNDPLDMLCDLIQTLNFSKVLLLRCSCIWSAIPYFKTQRLHSRIEPSATEAQII